MNNIFDYNILENTISDISDPIILNPFIVVEGVTDNPIENEEYTINGFLTNPDIKFHSTRNLHSMDIFRRGDTLTLPNGNTYMVIGDVLEKRGAKYKSEIRFCNHEFKVVTTVKILIGYEPNGRPIYEYIDTVIGLIPTIMETVSTSTTGGNIIIDDSKCTFTIRDNEYNRKTYSVNSDYIIDGLKWTIQSRDFTKEGLIILSAERLVGV